MITPAAERKRGGDDFRIEHDNRNSLAKDTRLDADSPLREAHGTANAMPEEYIALTFALIHGTVPEIRGRLKRRGGTLRSGGNKERDPPLQPQSRR